MRLLLLLSAFLTALTGGVVGTAACAQPVEASASVASVKPGASIHVVAALPAAAQSPFAMPVTWRAPAPSVARWARRSFGERRRE